MRCTAAVLLLALAPPVAAAPRVVSWEDADKHVGEEVVVEGRVLGFHCAPLSCLLAFEPTFNRFTAVIQADRFDVFPKPAELEKRYVGKRVRVRGTVRRTEGKPEIVLQRPEDLALVGAARERVRERQAETERAQAELFERMAEVLERVADVVERMSATQERMEAVLAALERRATELAAVQPPSPALPTYGEPQARPRFEALRSIKRGMRASDVARLVGDPLYVEDHAYGGATWHYGFGRTVTFNARGRAESLVGFPAP